MTRKFLLVASICLCAVAGAPGLAAATAIYQYQGDPFRIIIDRDFVEGSYTNEMSVSGSFTLADELAPNLSSENITLSILDFSFEDGRQTIGSAVPESRVSDAVVSTDADGEITEWKLRLFRGSEGLITTEKPTDVIVMDLGRLCPPGCPSGQEDIGSVAGGDGSWTLVPEPGTGALLSLGLGGLAVRRRRAA